MGAGPSVEGAGQQSASGVNASATFAALKLQSIARRRRAQRLAARLKIEREERDAIAAEEARKAARHEARLARRAERDRNRRASTCIQAKHRQRAASKEVMVLRTQRDEARQRAIEAAEFRAASALQNRWWRARKARELVAAKRAFRSAGEQAGDALLLAAHAGDVTTCTRALRGFGKVAGDVADPDWRDRDGCTSLHYCADSGGCSDHHHQDQHLGHSVSSDELSSKRLEIASLLLRAGATAAAVDRFGRTARGVCDAAVRDDGRAKVGGQRRAQQAAKHARAFLQLLDGYGNGPGIGRPFWEEWPPPASESTAAITQDSNDAVVVANPETVPGGTTSLVIGTSRVSGQMSQQEADKQLLDAASRGDLATCQRLVEEWGARPGCIGLRTSSHEAYMRPLPRRDRKPTVDVDTHLKWPRRKAESPVVYNASPLHLAAEQGHADVVAYLLSATPAPRPPHPREVPFSKALEGPQAALLPGDGSVSSSREKKSRGTKLLPEGSASSSSGRDDEKSIAGKLEGESEKYGTRADPNATTALLLRETALHWAARRGHAAVVHVLLQDPRTAVNLVDATGDSALHHAARNGHYTAAEALIGAGASTNLVNGNSRTPLGLARASQTEAELELAAQVPLLPAVAQHGDGFGGGGSDSGGFVRQRAEAASAMASACAQCCNVLELSGGAKISEGEASIALLTAARNGDLGACRLAIEHDGAHPDATWPMAGISAAERLSASDGFRPLHAAVSGGHAGVVEYLLYRGADKSLVENQGKTPKELALSLGQSLCERKLRDPFNSVSPTDKGANGGRANYRGFGPFGRGGAAGAFGYEDVDSLASVDVASALSTPDMSSPGQSVEEMRQKQKLLAEASMLAAARYGDEARVRELLEAQAAADEANGGGNNENEVGGGGSTGNDHDSWGGGDGNGDGKSNGSAVEYDLANCAAPMFGAAPLHLASHAGEPSLLELLVSHGADVYAKDRMGWTPLHYAAFTGPVTNVNTLLKLGADLEARSGAFDGARTALQVAQQAKRPVTVLKALSEARGPI